MTRNTSFRIEDFAVFETDRDGQVNCRFTIKNKINIFYFLYTEGFRYDIQNNIFYHQSKPNIKIYAVNLFFHFKKYTENIFPDKAKILNESVSGKNVINSSELLKYILNDRFNNDLQRLAKDEIAILLKKIELLEIEKSALKNENSYIKKILSIHEKNT